MTVSHLCLVSLIEAARETKKIVTTTHVNQVLVQPPKKIPCLHDITRMFAGLGGFWGRKGDGEPRVKTIWAEKNLAKI